MMCPISGTHFSCHDETLYMEIFYIKNHMENVFNEREQNPRK